MEMLRKITLKAVGLTVKAVQQKTAPLEDGEQCALVRVVGITTDVQTGQTDKGEFVRLIGEFQAVNLLTGKRFASGQCILPSFIAVSIAGALKVSPEVEFALEIGAKADEASVTGYQYTVRPLIETESNTRLSQLLSKSKALELPAPEMMASDDADEPVSAPEPAPQRARTRR